MQPRQSADDLEVAELLGADVHQQVFPFRILAVQALNGVLHGGRELSVRAAELFEQHVSELRVRSVDTDGVHQFLHVVVHGSSPAFMTWRAKVTASTECAERAKRST